MMLQLLVCCGFKSACASLLHGFNSLTFYVNMKGINQLKDHDVTLKLANLSIYAWMV